LEQPPRQLTWPDDSPPPQWLEQRQQLSVQCNGLGLLRLGTTPVGSYKIQLGIRQSPWVGGVGLFFGWHKDQVEGKPCVKLQLLQLQSRALGGGGKEFVLLRSRGTMWEVKGRKIPSLQDTASAILERVPPHEQILEIEVGRIGPLLSVRWGGKEMPGLTTTAANSLLAADDYRGAFGTFTSFSPAVFGNVRLMILER
jgi:hypothetical protein